MDQIQSDILSLLDVDPLGFVVMLEIWKYQAIEALVSAKKLPIHDVAKATHTEAPEFKLEGPACTMRPGDPGFEECEACQ